MAEVAVAKTPAKGETAALPWFRPMFPFPKGFFTANPFDMMREMTREMDRFFAPETPAQEGLWYPAVECKRTNGDLLVTAELPGLKKEDVKVEVTEDSIILTGERKHEEKVEKEGYYRSERSYGKFYREIPLPEGAKVEQAKAEIADGMLEVKIPVVELKTKKRQVAVEEAKKQ